MCRYVCISIYIYMYAHNYIITYTHVEHPVVARMGAVWPRLARDRRHPCHGRLLLMILMISSILIMITMTIIIIPLIVIMILIIIIIIMIIVNLILMTIIGDQPWWSPAKKNSVQKEIPVGSVVQAPLSSTYFADFSHGGEYPHDDQLDDFWDCISAACSCAP